MYRPSSENMPYETICGYCHALSRVLSQLVTDTVTLRTDTVTTYHGYCHGTCHDLSRTLERIFHKTRRHKRLERSRRRPHRGSKTNKRPWPRSETTKRNSPIEARRRNATANPQHGAGDGGENGLPAVKTPNRDALDEPQLKQGVN